MNAVGLKEELGTPTSNRLKDLMSPENLFSVYMIDLCIFVSMAEAQLCDVEEVKTNELRITTNRLSLDVCEPQY